MEQAIALAKTIIPLLPSLDGNIDDLVKWISKIRIQARAAGMWSDEVDIKFRTCLIASGRGDAWQPD